MIKFFRKIRQNLLSEGKTGKYLKYAVGEILLVVIGILIALGINNWNQNRILAKEELQLIKSLHKEFNKNRIKIDKAFEFHLNRKESIETIMTIKTKELSIDSLKSLLIGVQTSYTFDPHQGIYNSVINSGKIELISNDSLKERISGFQDLLRDFQEEEKYVLDFSRQNLHKLQLNETLNDNYKFQRGLVVVSKDELQRIKEKYIKFIESDIYKSHLIQLRGWMDSIFEEGPILREELDSIIKLLKIEIDTQ